MKILFDDGGYLEIQRSQKPNHSWVTVGVKQPNNPLELLVNSAEIESVKLFDMVKSVIGPVRLDQLIGKEEKNGN
jgi:hypothetical protein